MKKLLLIISLLMPATIAIGCKHNDTPTEEPIVEKPVINIPKNEIYAALEGGTYSISYTISNPIEDGKLEIGDIPEWIDNVNVTEDEIEVSVLANEKNINRSATMSASYTGAEKDASVKVFQDRVSKREDIFAMYTNSDIPYRIPAIAVTPTGRIICVADYRHSGADIGVVNNGRIDLHYRISDDNGESWGEVLTLIEG
ncbi:MAG: exo-alpha-sialidase, partial [Bacteroidales bacterium]|nr:exo-alpha-sialidase [Bacteroidales bacterium]